MNTMPCVRGSLIHEIRCRLAYDGEWVSKVLAVFLRVVGRWYRRQAQAMGHDRARWGSVTFVQRFGSSLNLNPPRLHLLRYHGVLAPRARDRGRIVPAKPVAEPAADGDTSAPSCTDRLGWAALLARVFSSDLSACATCDGP